VASRVIVILGGHRQRLLLVRAHVSLAEGLQGSSMLWSSIARPNCVFPSPALASLALTLKIAALSL